MASQITINYDLGNYSITYTLDSLNLQAIVNMVVNNISPSTISVTIPNIIQDLSLVNYTVSEINSSSCKNLTTLTNITLPYSITNIGVQAFTNCSSLQNIIIPPLVTNIDDNCFQYCTSLLTVTLNKNLTNIGISAFGSCNKLTTITIPNSVTNIGSSAFNSCSKLTSLTFLHSSLIPSIGANSFFRLPSGRKLYYNSNVTNASNLTSGSGVASGDLVMVNIYTDIQYINYYLYSDNTARVIDYNDTSSTLSILSSITNSQGTYNVTNIGDIAFINCSSLTSVTIPTSVTSIGSSAFYYNTSLTSVTFLQTPLLPTIGINAFSSNASGRKVYCYSTVTNSSVLTSGGTGLSSGDLVIINTSSNINYYLNDTNNTGTLSGYNGTPTTITIPTSITFNTVTYSVTNIGNNAFLNCISILNIYIPSSVTSIGSSSFSGCNSLTTITFPNTLTSIGSSAFYGCSSLSSSIII